MRASELVAREAQLLQRLVRCEHVRERRGVLVTQTLDAPVQLRLCEEGGAWLPQLPLEQCQRVVDALHLRGERRELVAMAGRGGCSELALTAVLYFPHRERRTANSSAVLLWRDATGGLSGSAVFRSA